MSKFKPSSALNWIFATSRKSRFVTPSLPPQHLRTNVRSMAYSSLHEASFFTVTDDSYDASKYGYRVFVPATPTRSGTTITSTSTTNAGYRRSSSATHYTTRHSYNDGAVMDDYTHCMQTIDPSSLDILSSPEVLAILESQREWDASKRELTYDTTMNSADDDIDDPYLSDCEEMHDSWKDDMELKTPIESFEKLPPIDEKKI